MKYFKQRKKEIIIGAVFSICLWIILKWIGWYD